MRRRQLMGAGLSAMVTPIVTRMRGQGTDSEDAGAIAVERVVFDTYDGPGLATGLSESGDRVLFGFDDGNVLVYDADRSTDVIPITVDRSVTHVEVRDATDTAVIGWIDADGFAPLELSAREGSFVEWRDLWDLAVTPDAALTAVVSSPAASTGGVGVVDRDGTVVWETPFDDATGSSVAITDAGAYVAAGVTHYWEAGTAPTGQPGIRLYDDTGSESWRYDYDEAVLAVGVDAERELVVAGTDDGHTIVLDFEGDVVWQTDAHGGWVVLSDDGGTVVTAAPDGTLSALESTTGDERWTADIDLWPAGDFSVSVDGSRVFAADRDAAAFVVVDEGEPIWTVSHDIGPGFGALASDGGTWSTIVTDLEDETAHVAIYRAPDPVAEPDPSSDADQSTDEASDSSTEEDASDDTEDDPAADDDTPVSLTVVDFAIQGELASEEYITLRNTGESTLEMTGWTIRDRKDGGRVGTNASPFQFPNGFTLDPGADVTIYTGTGDSTADTLYWGYDGDFQIWREESDIVIVLDADGVVVLEQPIAAESSEGSDEVEEPDEGEESATDDSPETPEDPPTDDDPEVPEEPPTDDGPEGPEEPPTDEPEAPPADDEPEEPEETPTNPEEPEDPVDDPEEPEDTPTEPADEPEDPSTDDPEDPEEPAEAENPEESPDESGEQPEEPEETPVDSDADAGDENASGEV
ncbi:lamin tail domain-containing protein [Halomontanus rarus]|uniref:lamin tail domain-containing protein n=1 Tax=Halomontanus rarus TaxID=3034020 RepID=UPI001A992C5C